METLSDDWGDRDDPDDHMETRLKVLIKCFHERLECQEQQNLQPKEMHRVDEAKGVGLLSGPP